MEYELMKSIDHPNILKTFDFLSDDIGSKHILITELVHGISLENYVRKNGI